tara:strand:- start:2701 stop:3072 length:372 start_codon:yes stop_codon:yes gene_type:complete
MVGKEKQETNQLKYTMKLELEFTITETSEDTIEGTWHGNIDCETDMSNAVYLQHYTELLIKQHIANLVENIDSEYGTGTHAWNRGMLHIEEKCGVSLFEENGKEIDPESKHGTFVAWKDGVPA